MVAGRFQRGAHRNLRFVSRLRMPMLNRQPTLYLLTGLPCSGKTTYARNLETDGVRRFSVDDMMIAANGRFGIDYPRAEHMQRLAPVLEAAVARVEHHLSCRESVVLDHGLGTRRERDRMKLVATTHNAAWNLISFDADFGELQKRCRARSSQPDTAPISDDTLDYLAATWDRPDGEGEAVVHT